MRKLHIRIGNGRVLYRFFDVLKIVSTIVDKSYKNWFDFDYNRNDSPTSILEKNAVGWIAK